VTGQAIVFLVLVLNQLVAIATFIGFYGAAGGWRDTAVGRHVMAWSVTAGVLELSWLLLLLAQWPWLVYVLFGAQLAVGLVTWQRVWLVWRARHEQP
jgi:hypothetical protein